MKPTLTIRFLMPYLAISLFSGLNISCNHQVSGDKAAAELVPAVNAYSFSGLLEAKDSRSKEQVYTLFNLLDWCASQNIKALDPTAYFFPTYPEVPSDEYLEKFRNHAARVGVAISGTGIRNNFASPDAAGRSAGVELRASVCSTVDR